MATKNNIHVTCVKSAPERRLQPPSASPVAWRQLILPGQQVSQKAAAALDRLIPVLINNPIGTDACRLALLEVYRDRLFEGIADSPGAFMVKVLTLSKQKGATMQSDKAGPSHNRGTASAGGPASPPTATKATTSSTTHLPASQQDACQLSPQAGPMVPTTCAAVTSVVAQENLVPEMSDMRALLQSIATELSSIDAVRDEVVAAIKFDLGREAIMGKLIPMGNRLRALRASVESHMQL